MTWFDTNYLHKKQITIDHTKISGSSDLTSFPVLISRVDTDLKTIGNGGHVQNASGFDIIFTNSAEAVKLDHEIEKYVTSTGEIEMWVRVPTLSHTVDTVIYMYYDNSTISTSQENVTGVWDSNFHAVFHLKETSGAVNSIKDSTGNANQGTPFTNWPGASGNISTSGGKIGTAQLFTGGAGGLTTGIDVAANTSLNISGQNTITLSAWIKRTASTSVGSIMVHGVPGNGGYMLGVGESPATTNQFKVTKMGVVDIAIGTLPADTNWHLVHEVGDAGGTYIYVDGSLSGTSGDTSNWLSSTANLAIGFEDAAVWDGSIDELRISNITRSAGWIGTEYNSQNTPSTFYSVGVEQSQTTTMNLVTQAQTKFYIRVPLQTQARAKFVIRLKLATQARAKFVIRLALKTQARSKFLVNQIINPLKQFKISFFSRNKYNVKFSEAAMVLPNSTTQSSATVTDASGNLQASLTGTVTVYYPGYPNTANSGPLVPVNVGGGVYTLTYTTLGPGLYKELWSFSDGSGNGLTDYNIIPCDY